LIFYVSSECKKPKDEIGYIDLFEKTIEPDLLDHDYVRYCWDLTPFVESIVLGPVSPI